MQARAYSEVEDPSLSVSIAGDAGEAKAAAQATPLERSDEDSGDSDAEGGGAKERRVGGGNWLCGVLLQLCSAEETSQERKIIQGEEGHLQVFPPDSQSRPDAKRCSA